MAKYEYVKQLCRDPNTKEYYLIETITNTKTGHVVLQKDIDVLVYEIKGGMCYFVECKQIENDAETVSDVAR